MKILITWFYRTFLANDDQKKHIVSLLRVLSIAISGLFIAPVFANKGDLDLAVVLTVFIFVFLIEVLALFVLSLLDKDKDSQE